jgi:hypothetical protein
MEAARAATIEEWLEGIPPVRHIKISIVALGFFIFDLSRNMIVFTNCATKRLEITERKTGFSIKPIIDIINHDMDRELCQEDSSGTNI